GSSNPPTAVSERSSRTHASRRRQACSVNTSWAMAESSASRALGVVREHAAVSADAVGCSPSDFEIMGPDSTRLLLHLPAVLEKPLTKRASAYQTLSAW